MSDIAAIVLAAGRATRFGGGKMAAPWRGKALVRHVAGAALAAGLETVVVTGHAREEVETALAGLDLRLVHNPAFADGMAGSLRCAIAALPQATSAAFVLLGDMPRISPALLRAMLAAWRAAPEETVALVPARGGARGNPVLLGQALFVPLRRLSGDQGARKLLANLPGVEEFETDDPAIFADIDTPAALRALEA